MLNNMQVFFLIAGLLLFVSVMATRLSVRLGFPLLLVFLGVGMLAGEEGVGGIRFNSVSGAMMIGQLALAVILLDGGLRTRLSTIRLAWKPAAVLASWGVLATVLLVGVFATLVLDVDWRLGLLMAAIVGSTDAAAVFSLLRNSGVRLNERVQSTLEVESGANDPMAIFLVSAFIAMLVQPQEAGVLSFLVMLAQQLGLGLVVGVLGGKILARLMHRLHLAEGLYALLILSGGILMFAATNLIGGSGFLAAYITGIFIGNQRSHATEHVLRVMDGLAWLAQASMFVVLGLLVTPSQLWEHSWQALLIALFLMLAARPLAVYSSIIWFHYRKRELAYISWVGLRGAVPITLAMMPLMMGVRESHLLFNVAFAVVILSLLLQGASIPWMAHWLKVSLPPMPEAREEREIWLDQAVSLEFSAYEVQNGADVEGMHPDAVAANIDPVAVRCFALIREGEQIPLVAETRLQPQDVAWYFTGAEHVDELAQRFYQNDMATRTSQHFFGEFELPPQARAGDLAAVYGLVLEENEADLNLRDLMHARLENTPVAGDRVWVGEFELIVKDTDACGEISHIGLKAPTKKRFAA